MGAGERPTLVDLDNIVPEGEQATLPWESVEVEIDDESLGGPDVQECVESLQFKSKSDLEKEAQEKLRGVATALHEMVEAIKSA